MSKKIVKVVIAIVLFWAAFSGIYTYLNWTKFSDSHQKPSKEIKATDVTNKQNPTKKLPVLPKRCSTLHYNIGIINDRFITEGYDKDKLLQMVNEAKQQWEQAIGKNLFEYNPSEKTNLINFIISGVYDPAVEVSGGTTYAPPLSNGAVDHFRIDVRSVTFDGARAWYEYYRNSGNIISEETIIYNDIYSVLLHEFGHALGLAHLGMDGPILSIKGTPPPTANLPILTKEDITFAKDWCAGTGQGGVDYY